MLNTESTAIAPHKPKRVSEAKKRQTPHNEVAVANYISKIDGLLATAKKSIFDIGKVLIEAKAALTKKHFAEVVKKSGLRSKSNADNYIRVAKIEHLQDPEIFPHLPIGIGALIDLAACSKEEIEECIRQRIMTPEVEATDA